MADLPSNYLLWNQTQVKNLTVIVAITGISDLFSNQTSVYTQARYGDPGLTFGQSGLSFGSFRKLTNIKDYLSLDTSSIAVQQKIEPEKGKGSITTFTLGMIDKASYFTLLMSQMELLGREVRVFIGYQQTSYPEDYFQIFRGYISDITYQGGLYLFQISDPGFKKRQTTFLSQTATLTSTIDNVTTTIPINTQISATSAYVPITNTLGSYDSAVSCYIKIDNEYIQYTQASLSITTQIGPSGVTRGTRSTTSASHQINASVQYFVQLQDHAIDMALKIMLSGWNGPWITGVFCQAFNNCLDPTVGIISGAILLPAGVDAKRDYGLVTGDLVTISGDSNSGLSGTIQGFSDAFGQTNRVIVTGGSFTTQTSTTSTLSFRSQYDAYPVSCGLKMTPQDVDVDRHKFLKNNFLTQGYNTLQFFIGAQESGKSFIESDLYLPIGAYAITRQGRSSLAYTKPPFGGAPTPTLDKTSVLKPEQIKPFRSTNKRKFFNIIQFQFDYSDAQVYQTILNSLDSNSLNIIGVTSILPIQSRGLRTSLGASTLVGLRATQLLNLYKNCALQIEVQTSWGIASQVEVGDPIILNDDGSLQIPNWTTGVRGLGQQTFTILERTLDVKQGQGKLVLMTGTGYLPTDRFASISPSSLIDVGSSSSQIVIKDSFNALYPKQEYLKWQNYVGNRVLIHSPDWSTQGECIFTGFDPSNKYKLNLSGLTLTPLTGYILELATYSQSTLPIFESNSKSAHTFLTPSITIVTGISTTQFTVSSTDALKFRVGLPVKIHDTSFTPATTSTEITVKTVTGPTITLNSALSFTPSAGQKVDLVGFSDGGQPYRFV